MTTTSTILLPGDEVPKELLPVPTNKNKKLKLSAGLQYIPPPDDTIKATIAGALATDNRKNAAWVDFNSGRYLPQTGDQVIATVLSTAGESFNCTLTPNTPPCLLPQLAFEGATRKTRPQLSPHSIVYAKILHASGDTAPELTCVDPSTGKADGMGPLKGGMLFPVSMGMARRLIASMKGGRGAKEAGVVVLEGLGEKMGFEVVVGRNGVVWVDAGGVRGTLAVGRAIQEVDRKGLSVEEQRKLVGKVLRGL